MSYLNYTTTNSAGLSNEPEQAENQSSIDQALSQLQAEKGSIAQREYQLLTKAMNSDNPNDIVKANSYWEDVRNRESSGLKTRMIDPNEWSQGAGYKQKRFQLDNYILRRMVSTTPIIKSIVGTRQSQVGAFSTPQKNKYETGFVVRKKREFYTDEEPEITDDDKKTINYITKFILNGGKEESSWSGDTFDTYLKKIVADSLTIDQACFEVVRSKRGEPLEYLAVDGATIMLADTYHEDDESVNQDHDYEGNRRKKVRGYLPSYVQVIDGIIHNEYYPWEMCFGIRNSTTDIRNNGYGKSEVEELVSIITWMLYGDTYNGKFFSQGSNPKGMLKVGSGVNRNRLAEFRQQWLAMVAGVQNSWKVPMVEGDVEWIDMQKGNRDMEFSQWQEYLIKVACAVFKIAPEEIGFNIDKNGGLGGDNDSDVKIRYSRDKGLKPLLKSIEFWINKWIVTPLHSDFEFKFVGLDSDSEEREIELLNKKVEHGMGLKEYRRAIGLPEDLEEGDFPLNNVYVQMASQQMYAEQGEENGEFVDEENQGDEFEEHFEDSENDLWATIGLEKSVVDEFEQLNVYRGNPLMKDALKTLLNE